MRMNAGLPSLTVPIALLTVLASGCSENPTNPPSVDYVTVDDFPTWSPDGTSIAFQRRPPSQYGPAGLYLLSTTGGTPAFLTGEAYNFLTYSSSGKSIIAVGSRGLVQIDADSGAEQLLAYSDNGIADPHMSPDGQWVAYTRMFRAPEEPAESSGVHIVNVSMGVDNPLLASDSSLVMGGWPRWAPSMAVLAYCTSQSLNLIDLNTREVTVIATARPGYFFAYPRWVQSGTRIMCSEIGTQSRTLVVDVSSHAVTQWPYFVQDMSALSPGDSSFVYRAPETQLGSVQYLVLYMRRLSDVNGSSIRRLTTFAEPVAEDAVVGKQ